MAETWMFLAPFMMSFSLTWLIERLCRKFHWLDLPSERKAHVQPVPRMGGLSFVAIPLLLGLILALPLNLFLVIGALVVFAGGLYDDLHPANSVWMKLLFQIPGALVLSLSLDLSAFGLPVHFWLVRFLIFGFVFFMVNAVNLMDNMNGLASGLALALTAGFAYVSYFQLHDHNLTLLCCLVWMSVLGFYVRNFPKGTIYMGDQGSQFLGYFLSATAIQILPRLAHTQDLAKVALSSMGLAVLFSLFLYDVVSVVRIRLREGRSPFQGDQCHISHRLVKRGLTPVQAVLTLTGAQAVLVVICFTIFNLT